MDILTKLIVVAFIAAMSLMIYGAYKDYSKGTIKNEHKYIKIVGNVTGGSDWIHDPDCPKCNR